MYSNFFCVPRFSSSSFRISPIYSSRVITVASMIGSSIFSISDGSGNLVRIVDFKHVAVGGGDPIAHAWRGGDQIDLELALQPLLNDLQMQQPQEAAAEAEAQRDRIFRLEAESAVVQPQLLERIAQQPVLVRFHRIQAREHHRLQRLETRAAARTPGLALSVMVSPICASETVLILANRNPTSPAANSSHGIGFGD